MGKPPLSDRQFKTTVAAIMVQADRQNSEAGLQQQITTLSEFFVSAMGEERGQAGTDVLLLLKRLFVRKRVFSVARQNVATVNQHSAILRAVENAALDGVIANNLTLSDIAAKSVIEMISLGSYATNTGSLWYWLTTNAAGIHPMIGCPNCAESYQNLPAARQDYGWSCPVHGWFGVPRMLLSMPALSQTHETVVAAEESYMDHLLSPPPGDAELNVKLDANLKAFEKAAKKASEKIEGLALTALGIADGNTPEPDDGPLPPPGRLIEL